MSKAFILFAGVILLFYWKSLFTFFQGDEWYYFTLTLPLTKQWYGPFLYVYKSLSDASSISSGAHFTPISNFLYFLSVKFFNFTYWPYALSGILIHVLNTFLVFKLTSRLLPRQRIIHFLAALFFAVSSIHQQAVTWVMTYLWTELSTTFLLLSLIFLLKGLQNRRYRNNIIFSSFFGLLAVLTKESSIVIFPLVFLLVFVKDKIYPLKFYFKTYGLIFVFYSIYRIFLPKFFIWISAYLGEKPIQSSPLDTGLLIFRAVTYPLKALTEVFVPSEWIRRWSEFLTPFAYPHYSDDMKILGRNYVVFTQTAGSDILIFSISAIILCLLTFSIFRLKKGETKNALMFSLAVIVFSAFPLLLIATYAPWWGYVTYIDSRHFYITSIGAAIIFALLLSFIKKRVGSKAFFIFLFIWGISQYFLIQNELDKALLTAHQRKNILSNILETVPLSSKNKIIFVESNQGYYGFINMPPFQTNLGQALAVNYYQKGVLSQFFINSDFLTKGGIRGEGFAEKEGRGFGYFLNRKTITDEIIRGKFLLNDVYAFSWDGKTDKISDQTKSFRKILNSQKSVVSETSSWSLFSDEVNKFSLRYPPNIQLLVLPSSDLKEIQLISNTLSLRIVLKEKPQELGLSEYVKRSLTDSDGKLVGSDFTYRNIYPIDRFGEVEDFYTSIYPTTGKFPKYFYPGKTSETFFEIEARGENYINFVAYGKGKYHEDVEKIISTISFLE